MTSHFTVIATWIEAVLSGLEAQGLDRRELTEGLGGLDAASAIPSRQFEVALVRRIWHRAAELSSDPLLGLKVGSSLPVQATHVVALIAMHSPTLREALTNTTRYQLLISNSGHYHLLQARQGMRLAYRPIASHVPLHFMQVDSVISGTIGLMRQCGLADLAPMEVALPAPDRKLRGAYEDYFRCPVQTGAKQTIVHYDAASLSRRIPGADSSLLKLALAHAETLLQAQSRFDSLSASVREAIAAHGFASVSCEEIAAGIGVSARTLQRRLAETGTTFRQLIEDARMQEAHYLLTRSTLSLPEISARLGYSDPSVLSRAARNWWGTTPRAIRRQAAPLPG
jgi:AraC-like DNA-binding protein